MYNPAMGFLEGLRRKKAEEDEAEKRAKANTERERIAGLERAKEQQLQREKEAEKAKNLLAKSKTKFHQAGMPELIKQLDEIKPIRFEEGYPEDEPYPPDMWERYGFRHQDWKYHCRVYLTKINYKPVGSLETHIEEVFFEIITDSEGTITFNGGKDKTIKTIKQSEWERTPKILEEALGKAYHSPVIIKFTSTPSRGPGGEG